MTLPAKPAVSKSRRPVFGEWSPIVDAMLMFALGLVAIVVFYASVFSAVHAVAVSGGSTRQQFGTVGAWVCGLFLLQGLVPLVRFSFSEVPRIVIGGVRLRWRDTGLFVLLLIAGVVLFLF